MPLPEPGESNAYYRKREAAISRLMGEGMSRHGAEALIEEWRQVDEAAGNDIRRPDHFKDIWAWRERRGK